MFPAAFLVDAARRTGGRQAGPAGSEGSSRTALRLVRDVPQGGVDVLDAKVQWQFPSGVLRCLSPRELRRATAADFAVRDSLEDYKNVAAAFGYEYLGGGCDVLLVQHQAALQVVGVLH